MENEEFYKQLSQFESIIKEVQKENTDFLIARACFDEAMEFCPGMYDTLSPTARIVLQPHFESALCKIFDNKCEIMCEEESDV